MAARRADRRKAERRRKDIAADNIGPTREQLRKGGIDRLPDTITDDFGTIARPWRHRATLAILYERDIISKDELAAGAFRTRFRHACFDPLKALDPTKVPNTYSPLVAGEHQLASRDYIWRQSLRAPRGPRQGRVRHSVQPRGNVTCRRSPAPPSSSPSR